MSLGSKKHQPLTRDELREPFRDELGKRYGPILTPEQLADLLGYSRSTIYFWIAEGRFDGAFRRRGKHVRFWRDRALDLFFNSPDWSSANGGSHENN